MRRPERRQRRQAPRTSCRSRPIDGDNNKRRADQIALAHRRPRDPAVGESKRSPSETPDTRCADAGTPAQTWPRTERQPRGASGDPGVAHMVAGSLPDHVLTRSPGWRRRTASAPTRSRTSGTPRPFDRGSAERTKLARDVHAQVCTGRRPAHRHRARPRWNPASLGRPDP